MHHLREATEAATPTNDDRLHCLKRCAPLDTDIIADRYPGAGLSMQLDRSGPAVKHYTVADRNLPSAMDPDSPERFRPGPDLRASAQLQSRTGGNLLDRSDAQEQRQDGEGDGSQHDLKHQSRFSQHHHHGSHAGCRQRRPADAVQHAQVDEFAHDQDRQRGDDHFGNQQACCRSDGTVVEPCLGEPDEHDVQRGVEDAGPCERACPHQLPVARDQDVVSDHVQRHRQQGDRQQGEHGGGRQKGHAVKQADDAGRRQRRADADRQHDGENEFHGHSCHRPQTRRRLRIGGRQPRKPGGRDDHGDEKERGEEPRRYAVPANDGLRRHEDENRGVDPEVEGVEK